eukprot:TRINITY_DN3664_c0_g1_i1.p1 TRINITY_DN3664_c0_g1~~TRINITY_DN3664_c0_g1_i1.p1  ORF type:complete len:275 (-),score=71.03 TRINITY_DN3664_c0_g1_i1:24-848(-)
MSTSEKSVLLATAGTCLAVGGVLGWLTRSYLNNQPALPAAPYQQPQKEPKGVESVSGSFEVQQKNKVQRLPLRASYDKQAVYQILKAGHFCHVAFVRREEDGSSYPVSIPTLYGVQGDYIYIHGHSANGMMRQTWDQQDVSLTVALLDGLVYAKSLFHSSVNYRSVVVFGKAERIEQEGEKLEALEVISEQIMPGRWAEAKVPTKAELKATSVIRIQIQSASAKAREGLPKDDKEDLSFPVWSGIVPISIQKGQPITDTTSLSNYPPSLAILQQ